MARFRPAQASANSGQKRRGGLVFKSVGHRIGPHDRDRSGESRAQHPRSRIRTGIAHRPSRRNVFSRSSDDSWSGLLNAFETVVWETPTALATSFKVPRALNDGFIHGEGSIGSLRK